MVTHLIEGLRTLCGLTLNDENWPVDHNWVSPVESVDKATCAKCRSAADLNVTPEHYLDQIESIYAFLSVDEGGEGIIALPIGPDSSLVPLIASDKARMDSIIPLAKSMANVGMKINLVRFERKELIQDFSTERR